MSISPNRGRQFSNQSGGALATYNSGIKKNNNYIFGKKQPPTTANKQQDFSRSHIYQPQLDHKQNKQNYTYLQNPIESRAISFNDYDYPKKSTIGGGMFQAAGNISGLSNSQQDLQKKIQIILKHNSHLLSQNASLSQLICQKNSEIDHLQIKLQSISNGQPNSFWIESQKKKLLQQLQKRQANHKQQIQKLLQEISQLHDQCYSLENSKNLQMHKLKETYQKQFYNQIQNLKRNQNANIELYETQIRRLKQQLQQKSYTIQSVNHENKISYDRLNQQVFRLTNQNKHLVKIRELELEQCRMHYQNQVYNKFKDYERKMQIQANNMETTVRKIKKQLADKNAQIQKMTIKIGKLGEQNAAQLQLIRQQKQKLKYEATYAQQMGKQQRKQELERIQKFNQFQIQTIQITKNNYIDSLKSQNLKLIELTDCKSNQIKNLYDQLKNLRELHIDDIKLLRQSNNHLREKMQKMQLTHNQQIQLLKIRMSQLHSADVTSVRQYLENQILILSAQLLDQQKINKQSRQTIQKQIQQKNDLRKSFQNQISKYKVKVSELKIKLATAHVEMKAEVTSMASKMQLTSQTFLRQQTMKQKQSAFNAQQRKKFHQIVIGKENQIKNLEAKLQREKVLFQGELKVLKQELQTLKTFSSQLDEGIKKQKQFYQTEIKKKQLKFKSDMEGLRKQISEAKGNTQVTPLKNQILKLQKQNLKNSKQLQFLQKQHKILQQQLNLKNGFLQTVQLQSSAALQQQRSKVKIMMSKNESGLKTYYEQKIKQRETQVQTLRQQINEREQDLRDVIEKYNQLQRKLGLMLDSQQKLRDFENKIINIGMDTNLVKNLAELFKTKF